MYQYLFEQFLIEKEGIGRSPYTLKKYRLHVGYFLQWYASDHQTTAQPLTRPLASAYLRHLRSIKTPNTTANYFADLGVFCTWLVENQHLATNPTERLKPKRIIRRMPSYRREHIERLYTHTTSDRDRALLICFLDTGLRASELASLRRADLDMTTGHFLVIGKGNQQRSGWFSPLALDTLTRYLATRHDSSPYLWLTERGTPLGYDSLRSILRRRVADAGLRGQVSRLLHSFRSTFAKNYLKRGGDVLTLADLLGHRTLTMTRRYAQLDDDDLAQHKQRINPLGEYTFLGA